MPLTHLKERLRQTRIELTTFFDAPENVLVKRYAPGKWTVRELLCHLADAEMVYLWRVCRALAEPGAAVEGFDQDVWAEELHYNERSLEVSRNLFEANRAQLLYYVEGILPEQMDNTVQHSERGVLSLRQLLDTVASHTEHHIEQMKAARDGEPWTPKAAQ